MAYGLSILNEDGDAEIFGNSTPNTHFLAGGQATLTTVDPTVEVTVEGMTASNHAIIGLSVNSQNYTAFTVTRGAGKFTVTNTGSGTITVFHAAFRYK
tara:strand:+ start:854 stop:1147 length:294 start_codon:yes stop_codon:yes gene_type:complete